MRVFLCIIGAVGSSTCGRASSIAWFITGRVTQCIAEGIEPISMMMGRDAFADPDERMAFIAGIMATMGIVPHLPQ